MYVHIFFPHIFLLSFNDLQSQNHLEVKFRIRYITVNAYFKTFTGTLTEAVKPRLAQPQLVSSNHIWLKGDCYSIDITFVDTWE